MKYKAELCSLLRELEYEIVSEFDKYHYISYDLKFKTQKIIINRLTRCLNCKINYLVKPKESYNQYHKELIKVSSSLHHILLVLLDPEPYTDMYIIKQFKTMSKIIKRYKEMKLI